ncbi:MAG: MurR/RpiR family transcriptional regulator [Acidimicrobiales bacterium]
MGSTISKLAASLPELNPSEARVANRILAEPATVVHQSITELAEDASTSLSTVVRLCQRLGFSGFQSLKIALAQEATPPSESLRRGLSADSGTTDVLRFVTETAPELMRNALSAVDIETFEQSVDALAGATRVLFLGAGTSASVVQDAAYRFRLLGIPVDAPTDPHAQHVAGRALTTTDVCLSISHTGSTRETIAATTAARASGATRIAITSYGRSPLASEADLVLVAGIRGLSVNFALQESEPVLPTVSRLAHLVVVDALVVALARQDVDRAAHIYSMNSEVLSSHLV